MEIKIIKDYKSDQGVIQRGALLKARALRKSLTDFNPRIQVVSGKYSGEFIPREYFIEHSSEKTYTEKEWNDMENYYMDLLEKEREKVRDFQTIKNDFLRQFESILKQATVAKQVSAMLDDWLNKDYREDEEKERYNFALELTEFIQEKLT